MALANVFPFMNLTTSSVASVTRGVAILAALSVTPGCDSKEEGGGDSKGAKSGDAKGGGGSEKAAKVDKEVAEMKGKLGKGEDIKYACAGNIAQYADLASSSDDAEKKSYAALQEVCYVELPKALVADLRKKIESGEKLKTTATVDLQTVLNDKKFPTDGEAAKVAADAKKLTEVELPAFNIKLHLETAKKEKEESKNISMGCIKAKQVVEKSKAALEADETAKAVLVQYAEACPEK